MFFAIFDPVDLSVLWAPLGPSTTGAYVEAYLLFWVFGAVTSAITLLLQGRVDDVAQDGRHSVRPKSRSRWYATDRRRA